MNGKKKDIEKDTETLDDYILGYDDKYDSIAVLDTPLEIEGKRIYGVMYNREQERLLKEHSSSGIDRYIAYHRGIELWLKAGCDVVPDSDFWYYPENLLLIKCTPSVLRVIYTLMKNQSGNRKYEFDEYIQWNEDEVNDRENRMVIKESLIKRYIDKWKPMESTCGNEQTGEPYSLNCTTENENTSVDNPENADSINNIFDHTRQDKTVPDDTIPQDSIQTKPEE